MSDTGSAANPDGEPVAGQERDPAATRGSDTVHHPATLDPAATRRAVTAAAIGNMTEWYDFGVYSYLAGTIGVVFYPSASPAVQLIASFTTFAAAFLIRPLGGLVLGPIGDRVGRQRVLALTMLMMALGTSLIGMLPTAGAVGILAPILLLVCRMVQGFSTGGEYGGATTFIAEYAPDRRRGFLGSWLEFGTITGYITGASIVSLLTLLVGSDAMTSWGWRIPFLLALPLGTVGLYLRLKLGDTPAFAQTRQRQETLAATGLRTQFQQTVVRQWRPLLICVGIVLAFNVNNYMVTAYLPTYLESEIGYAELEALGISLIAMVLMLVCVTFVGRISDRVGRRWVLFVGGTCSIVLALPAFWLLQQGPVPMVLFGTILLALTLVQFSGSVPSTLPALFPTRVRYGAMAIGFNISVALFGGTTPLVAESLVQATGSLYAPALQVMVAGVVGILAVSRMTETANRPLLGAMPAVAGPRRAGPGGQVGELPRPG